jgi:protein-S-isoprenylcysteine O-methyltransferase Ste14
MDPEEPTTDPVRSRLPSLGPRGEGWVALQGVLIVAAVLAGLRGPRWPQVARRPRVAAALPLALAGAALFAAGSRGLGHQLTPFPRPHAEGTLRREGAYAYVRHPIYGGVLLLAWAWTLLTSPLALVPAALGIPFLEAKRHREEAWLAERHPGYSDYQRLVSRRFIPFVW